MTAREFENVLQALLVFLASALVIDTAFLVLAQTSPIGR